VSVFDQRDQQVQYQYNAAGDINIGAVQNQTELVGELEKLKAEVVKAKDSQALDEDTAIDVDYQLTKAITQARKPEPDGAAVVGYLSEAKTLIEGIVAVAGISEGLAKAMEILPHLLQH